MSALGLALLLAAATEPAAAAPAASPPAGGTVVERLVAVVRNPIGGAPRPLTLTRLDQEARVALVGQGGIGAAHAPLDTDTRRAALRWLIDQWLVADEAQRLKVDDVPGPEVQAALLAFRERFADPAAYRAFLAASELREEELLSILARGLRVQRFLDNRLGRGVRIADEEALSWLAGQGSPAPTAEERDAARARLSGERIQAQARQLLSDLRSRADIRILVPELRDELPR